MSSKGYVFEDNRRVLIVSSSKRGLCEDKCRVLPIPSSKHSLFEDNCKSVLWWGPFLLDANGSLVKYIRHRHLA